MTASGRAVPTEFLVAIIGFYILIPICVQCILLLRIIAVYPPYALTLVRRVLIYGTLVALLIARVINAGIGLHKLTVDAKKTRDWEVIGSASWALPNSRVEWFLQLFYDVCVATQRLSDSKLTRMLVTGSRRCSSYSDFASRTCSSLQNTRRAAL